MRFANPLSSQGLYLISAVCFKTVIDLNTTKTNQEISVDRILYEYKRTRRLINIDRILYEYRWTGSTGDISMQ